MSKPMISSSADGLLARPLRDTSIDEVSHIFLRASKDPSIWKIGMEIELTGFHRRDLAPLEYPSMPKMPKERYDVMRAFFRKKGGRGLDMMHCTGSVQCAVDYRDEANMTDKIRTAVRASPFLAALVASSPFSLGKPNGFKTERYN